MEATTIHVLLARMLAIFSQTGPPPGCLPHLVGHLRSLLDDTTGISALQYDNVVLVRASDYPQRLLYLCHGNKL